MQQCRTSAWAPMAKYRYNHMVRNCVLLGYNVHVISRSLEGQTGKHPKGHLMMSDK